jgi:ferric-dicitrate binding protein FerR (iron transport regulator)
METTDGQNPGGFLPGACPPPEDVALFLDSRLSRTSREEIESHLVACPVCRAAMVAAVEALGAAQPAVTGAAGAPRDRAGRGVRLWIRVAAAAAVLALLASAVWLSLAGRKPAAFMDSAQGSPAAATAAGFELAGGFLAASGTGESDTLCVQSDGETLRWALVRGSLFVELGPEAPPVRLITPHMTITADPGEVRVNVSPARTDVFVGSGQAMVEGRGGKAPLRLSAGQAAEAFPARDPARAAPARGPRTPDWVRLARARRLEEIASAAFPSLQSEH